MCSLELLPNLAVAKIASYLQPRDLLACSAVCKKWREKFNIDAIWTPHLQFVDKYYSIQEKYKEMILCPPLFETLEPLCVGRERYIRDQCLRYNCRAGLFTIETLEPKSNSKVFHLINTIDKEGNYWLFMNTVKAIEVWNITNKPFFQSSLKKVMQGHSDSLYVIDTKVVLLLYDFVQVFTFEHPKYQLEFECCFSFDHNSTSADVQNHVNTKTCCFEAKHLINGNILIGYRAIISKSQLRAEQMHIWNLETLVKLQTTNIIHETFYPIFFRSSASGKNNTRVKIEIFQGSTKNILISLLDEELDLSSLLLFNLEHLKFHTFAKYSTRTSYLWCSFANERVMIFGSLMRDGFFLNLIDVRGRDIVLKHLSRYSVDCNSQCIPDSPKMYIKTAEDVILTEIEDDGLKISTLIEDENFSNETVNVVNIFIFSKNIQGLMKMWDIQQRRVIRDFPIYTATFELQTITSLKEIDFPPKILCCDSGNNRVFVFSFW